MLEDQLAEYVQFSINVALLTWQEDLTHLVTSSSPGNFPNHELLLLALPDLHPLLPTSSINLPLLPAVTSRSSHLTCPLGTPKPMPSPKTLRRSRLSPNLSSLLVSPPNSQLDFLAFQPPAFFYTVTPSSIHRTITSSAHTGSKTPKKKVLVHYFICRDQKQDTLNTNTAVSQARSSCQ